MFKKIFIFLFLIIFQTPLFASDISSSVSRILNSYDFDKNAIISISIKDKNNSKTIYSKSPNKDLNPASAMKLFSSIAAINTLGEDFEFQTAIYKDAGNNFYVKLSGDPLLKEEDLNILAKKFNENYKGKINKIYIDDSIIDLIPYPDSWQVDDTWPSAPKISPYMVDNNTVSVDILLSEDKRDVRFIQRSPYRFSFVNRLQSGPSNNIKFIYDEEFNVVNVEGTIASSITGKKIPVLNPRYFFCKKLNDALNKNGIKFNDKFLFAKTPEGAVKIAEFSRPLEVVVKQILNASDNIASEMLFKVAGAKYALSNSPVRPDYNHTFGTTENGINMFIEYYDSIGLDTDEIQIRDGSGVSRYDILHTDWMNDALIKSNFNLEKYLPTANQGTLTKRMRGLENKVYFKTGTHRGTSALTGIIKAKDTTYCYSSIMTNYKINHTLLKAIEDEIVYEIYRTEGQN